MAAYYNENDPKAAAWLRELIKVNAIAPGDVDERSIEDVIPNDVKGFRGGDMSDKFRDYLCFAVAAVVLVAFLAYQHHEAARCTSQGGVPVRKLSGGMACVRELDHAPTLEEMGQADERGVTP